MKSKISDRDAPFDTELLRMENPIPEYLEKRGFQLKRAGAVFRMLCPFHEEKTPSFSIWVDHFHCYGCSVHGDVIELDQRLHRRSFEESCLSLGGRRESPSQGAQNPPTKDRSHEQRINRTIRLQTKARAAFPLLLDRYQWRFGEVWSRSPVPLRMKWGDQWRYFLRGVFPKDAIVWIGDLRDSGMPGHSDHFRARDEWLKCPELPGPRIAAAHFSPGSYSRCGESVEAIPLIVVEADEAIGKKPETEAEVDANRSANLAILRWMREGVGLNLRAIIDSGNKSLHGWFDHPGQQALDDLARIAGQIGIDDLVRKPTQPLRLPGMKHEKGKRPSNLIWLSEA